MVTVLYASGAYASGDPMVLYWMVAGGLTQVTLLLYILMARKFRVARSPATAAYVLYLVLLWTWIWNSTQSPTYLGIALVVLPLLAVGVLSWVIFAVASARERSD